MLRRASRLTSGPGFAHTIRRGRRAGTSTVVVHLVLDGPMLHDAAGREPGNTARVGFVVSRAVGDAVTRNQVKRRLRHLVRERLTSLPGAAVLVVRAQPAAASASSAQLGADLDAALARALPRRTVAGTSS